MEIRIAAVDDNEQDLEQLRKDLYTVFEDSDEHTVNVKTFTDAGALLSDFYPNAFQLAILDIRMHEINGIELAAKLREKDMNLIIVFLSTSKEYAFDAFPLHSFDYLIKPYTIDKLKKLVYDVVKVLTGHDRELTLKIARGTCTLPLNRISSIESAGHSVLVCTSGGNVLRCLMKFSEFTDALKDDRRFLLCNRGIYVNMDHVFSFRSDTITMQTGKECQIKIHGRTEIINALTQYLFDRVENQV